MNTVGAAVALIDAATDAAASHNCRAYRLGHQYRFNDDGEPSGTAGKPILQAIDARGFDHLVVVVAGWFGAIKLGAGGLMRAYAGCAAECLRRAPRIDLVATTDLRFSIDFAAYAMLRARVASWPVMVLDETVATQGVCVSLHLAQSRRDEFCSLLADLTRGQAQAQSMD